jgi:outer membrane protein
MKKNSNMRSRKKNNIKKILFVLYVLCDLYVLLPGAFAQRQLSLQDAIKIGLEQNHDIKIAIFKSEAVGESKVNELVANRLPSLKLNAYYLRLSDIGQPAITIPNFPPIVIPTYFVNNYSLKFSLFAPIFNEVKRQEIHAAEHTANAAQADVKTSQSGVTFQIKQQYWNLYKLQRTLEAVNKNLEEARAHLEDVRSKLKEGTVLPNDTLRMMVQVSTAELRKIQTEKDIRVAMAALMSTIGLPLHEQVTIDSKPDGYLFPFISTSLSELIEKAKKNRPELGAISERINAANSNIRMARSGYYPQVAIAGNFYYQDPNQRYFPAQNVFKATWDASINLNWDLWTWNAAGFQADEAEYTMEQLQETKKQMEDAIALEVTQTYYTRLTAAEAIHTAHIASEQAQENSRVISVQYSKGVANTTDVIDAEAALLQARVNLAEAETDASIAEAQLEKSLGE